MTTYFLTLDHFLHSDYLIYGSRTQFFPRQPYKCLLFLLCLLTSPVGWAEVEGQVPRVLIWRVVLNLDGLGAARGEGEHASALNVEGSKWISAVKIYFIILGIYIIQVWGILFLMLWLNRNSACPSVVMWEWYRQQQQCLVCRNRSKQVDSEAEPAITILLFIETLNSR